MMRFSCTNEVARLYDTDCSYKSNYSRIRSLPQRAAVLELAATEATLQQGFDAKKGYLITGNGAVVLLTQFVKGTDASIDISWERTSARLTFKWPDSVPTMPSLLGQFVVGQKAQ